MNDNPETAAYVIQAEEAPKVEESIIISNPTSIGIAYASTKVIPPKNSKTTESAVTIEQNAIRCEFFKQSPAFVFILQSYYYINISINNVDSVNNELKICSYLINSIYKSSLKIYNLFCKTMRWGLRGV